MGAQETAGWFNKKIESVNDFKGLRMRMPGLGGKTLTKLGSSVSMIPLGECFFALEKGAIDAMELGSPMFDVAIGPHKVTKYNYFPGWHQPTANMDLVVNTDIWNKMSKAQQTIMFETAIASSVRAILEAEVKGIPVMKDNEAKRNVKNMILPPEVLEAL